MNYTKALFLLSVLLLLLIVGCGNCEECSIREQTYTNGIKQNDITVNGQELCGEDLDKFGDQTTYDTTNSNGNQFVTIRTFNCF